MRRGSLVVTFVALFGLAIPLLGGARGPSPATPPPAQTAAARAHVAEPPPSKAPAAGSPGDEAPAPEKAAPKCAEGDAVCECERRLFRPLAFSRIGTITSFDVPGQVVDSRTTSWFLRRRRPISSEDAST